MKRGKFFNLMLCFKNLRLCLKILMLSFLSLSFLNVNVSALDTQNFYFSDFTVDYYVSKNNEGVSEMRVVEKLTAEFPDYNQNKGICRMIPYLNNGGKNNTLPSLTKADIAVRRNGETEPIYSIEKNDGYYEVCTGTEDYVTGTQVYSFEYTFKKVITEYSNKNKSWQELYWDTNGNAWKQRFDKLTARVHFGDTTAMTGETSCYVGYYGEKGSERCKVSQIDDGYEFETSDLMRGENLTFDVELKAGSFVIPEPEKSYIMFVILGVALIITGLVIKHFVKKSKETSEKRKFYKSYFIKPEYQPHKDYTLPEMEKIYLGKTKDVKVAIILKMIVEKKIEMIKGEKKLLSGYKWKIRIKNKEALATEEENLLKILNGGSDFANEEEIELKTRAANSTLVSLGEKVRKAGIKEAKADKLAESGFSGSSSSIVVGIIATIVIVIPIFFMAMAMFEEDVVSNFTADGKVLVGMGEIVGILILLIILWIVLSNIKSVWKEKYGTRTLKGLEASRYMDGLKMYIEMAEKDRMAFLQSVKGADTSNEGVVRLYEKLLPYAALFGVEESWMNELAKFCQVNDIETSTWNMADYMVIRELSRAVRTASSISTSSSTYSSSGSSSSGFSGGGGGGFSGGGGGGGGGGGR